MPEPAFLSGDQVPDYLRGVELMTAGMEWPAMSGPTTVTMAHLADAVEAANNDPHVQLPRIKLGHTSPLNGDHPDFDPFAAIGDAEPSFGQFTNLRLENDGAVLVGDATNVPAWLAAMAPSAYPNRSAEAPWQVESPLTDVQTPGGKRYSMCISAVSFLGVVLPAISDLEDLETLVTSGPAALASKTAAPAAAGDAPPSAMSISEDEIRQRFNWDWAMDPENEVDAYWWWCREVRVTEGEVIADDDEGHLFEVPFTEADGVVTFGEPAQVRKTYIPVAASTTQVACFARPSKPQRPPAAATSPLAAIVRPDPEGGTMDENVRQFLEGQGHDPATATEAQIKAAEEFIAAFPAAPAEPPADEPEEIPTGEAADDEPAGEAEAEPGAERVPVAAARQVPDGMSLIDSATLADLKAGAAAGTQLAREKATDTRDRILSAARDEGRFPPARLAHYRTMYDADPEGTTVLLTADEDKGGLAKGTVPLAARAEVTAQDATGVKYGEDGLLAPNLSLLTPSKRAELLARRAI
jgi:hypothetical protein